NHPKIGEIRGEGLLLAVEFVQDRANRSFFEANHKVGATVAANLLKEGVIGRAMPQGDILGLAPPLCLSQNEALQIVDSLVRAVERTF
ncbi:MAG: aminotransferase class III-fold pyridoxal phosphate-dependent enzyme, partial [Deltaproteobacteria bacterium]